MDQFWDFFSFPLNFILAMLWMVGFGLLWKHKTESYIIRFLLSPAATIISLSLLLCFGLMIGFGVNCNLVHSLPFVLSLLFVQTVVYVVTLRGWKTPSGRIRWRFLLIHAGFLIALGSAFWGAPDAYELRVQLQKGQTSQVAYEMNGSTRGLGYEIELKDCNTEYSMSGMPTYHVAVISLDGEEDVSITVNHPYRVRYGEDIYLTSLSEDGRCVLQIVHEPWKYFAIAGIIMLIVGALMLFFKGPGR